MMRAARPWNVLGLALAMALALLPVGRLPAQEPSSSFGSTTAFRFLLGPQQLDLAPLKSLDDLMDDRAHSLLIVLGDTRPLEAWGDGNLRSYLAGGGALLVATDHRTGECVKRVFGAQVTGEHLRALNPNGMYLGKHADCPVMQREPGHPELFRDTGQIVTNVPSYFEEPQDGWRLLTGQRIVARLPMSSAVTGRALTDPPCALIYQWGRPRCRVLLLSDQDIFIDGMMFQTQNDNFIFAYNALQWLTDSRQRTDVLFYDNGQVVTDFSVPLQWAPRPPLPPPITIADHLLAGLEQENAFNRLLHSLIPHQAILAMAAVLVTLLLAARWLYHVLTRRVRLEGNLSLAAAGAAPQTRLPSLVKQRHQAMLQAGNLWEAAQELARHAFEDHVSPPQPAHSGSTIAEPALAVAGPPWRTWRLHRRARQLWRLAYGAGPRLVTRREFGQLVAWSEDVHTALVTGRLRLIWATPPHGRRDKA